MINFTNMRILHMHTSLSIGGVEAVLCELLNEICHYSEVTLCTIFSNSSSPTFESKLSPKIIRYSLNKQKKGFSLTEIVKICLFLRKKQYDVVHIHGFFYYYFLAILLLHHRIKFVYTIHSDAKKECTYWDQKLFLFKRLFFKLKWIHPVTISKESKRSFTELYGIDSTLIYNGVKSYESGNMNNMSVIGQYRYTSKTRIFIHPGRITEAKNQVMLCSVFHRLISENEDVVLLIVGSKQDDAIYKQISSYFSERIIYLGERTDARDLIAQADAFCLSSKWEGFPIALLESISVGCIPICTSVGGIPEVITDKKSGFLSTESSEDAYYLAVKGYLNQDDHSLNTMKEECLNIFKQFSSKHMANEYIKLYNDILKSKKNI